MNEEELKQLWKSAEVKETPKIDFEQVQKNMNNWHGKLRRKIELDFLAGAFILIIFLVVTFIYPHGLYYLPVVIIASIWYFRRIWRMYQAETTARKIENTKEYLEQKAKELKDFIKKNRVGALVFSFPATLYAFSISAIFDPRTKEFFQLDNLSKHPDLIYTSLIFCVILSILAIIIIEISIRISYLPSLDELRALLKELESE